MSAYRRNGQIASVSSERIPQNILCLDTETFDIPIKDNVTEFVFKCGVTIDFSIDKTANVLHRSVNQFLSHDDMCDYIEDLARQVKILYVFGHNVGFDLRVLSFFKYLTDNDYNSEPPIINERVFIFTARKKGAKIIVLDTANFAIQSVYLLGKSMGYTKLKVNFKTVSMKKLLEYCQRDVEILERFILDYIRFIHSNDLGGFKNTLASQSLQAWRYRFIDKPVILHSNKLALEMERKGYHGGRVECFRMGKQPKQDYYYLDINSMYPYVMSTTALPYSLVNVSYDKRTQVLATLQKRYYTISEVIVKTDIPCYPLFHNNRLLFPVGTYKTVLHHAELANGLANGHIKFIEKTYIYHRAVLFKGYVDFFYGVKLSAKLTNNPVWEFIAKIFLNGLYGKWGQTDVTRKLIGHDDHKGIWRIPWSNICTASYGQFVCWFGDIWDEIKQGETSFSFPALAGAITASCRMLLWSYIEKAGKENVFYVDTDSLIVNTEGYNNLLSDISSTQLGKLKLVSTSNRFYIRGCKDYTFGKDDKTKGKSKDAIDLKLGKWQQLQFESVLAWLNRGGIGGPRGTMITKRRSGKYEKGNVNPDGTISPFTLESN